MSKYSAKCGGHAPDYLRNSLTDAVGAPWHPWCSYLDCSFYSPAKQARWDSMTPLQRGRWLIGQLWNCTDIVPCSTLSAWGLPRGSNYAVLVRELKNYLPISE